MFLFLFIYLFGSLNLSFATENPLLQEGHLPNTTYVVSREIFPFEISPRKNKQKSLYANTLSNDETNIFIPKAVISLGYITRQLTRFLAIFPLMFSYTYSLESQDDLVPAGNLSCVNRDYDLEQKNDLISTKNPLNIRLDRKEVFFQIADTIRHLSMDAVKTAKSGYPGIPGCAEIGSYLYGYYLNYNPYNPSFFNRDRFILSAGHGSLLQYTCLHLAGFKLSLADLKRYRQGGSLTSSHPSTSTEGVETVTGALGHGVANGIGIALGLKIIEKKFFGDNSSFLNSKVVILAGDGCLMEGLSGEASSLAGYLQLNNLILVYDSNEGSLDGNVNEISSEDTALRYKAYGWNVVEINGHDFDEIHNIFRKTRTNQKMPLFIIAKTQKGRGITKNKSTLKSHEQLLKNEEVREAKKESEFSNRSFHVEPIVYDHFEKRRNQLVELENQWNIDFEEWSKRNPELYKEWQKMSMSLSSLELEKLLEICPILGDISGRYASKIVVNCLSKSLPFLYGGSADLSKYDGTFLGNYSIIKAPNYAGRNIKYGAREFSMGAMAIGLSQTKMITPFVGTFLMFSDYMRHSIRTAALMRTQVIFQLTHDSIFVGEDGPTHQPIEHIASLRVIPNLQVIRPADQHEVKNAWIAALMWNGPTTLILSRQILPELSETQVSYKEGVGRGAYIVKKENSKKSDYIILATGSEVHLALNVAHALGKKNYSCRVVSMPCWEIFEKQSEEYKKSILEGSSLSKMVSIEAGVNQGWHKYIGKEGISISVEEFGIAGSVDYIQEKFGFTVDAILSKILEPNNASSKTTKKRIKFWTWLR